MKKLALIALAILSLSACDKITGKSPSHSTFVKMCKEDPQAQAQSFDCDCQADVLNAVLKQDELTKLIDFIEVEKKDKAKAMEMSKDPAFSVIFKKIAGVGYAIHDKCGKPGAEPAPQAATPETAPAGQSQPAPAQTAPSTKKK